MSITQGIHRFEIEFADRVKRSVDVLSEERARRAQYRRTYDELQAYTDRELVDIGIIRNDIPSLARRAAGY